MLEQQELVPVLSATSISGLRPQRLDVLTGDDPDLILHN